MSETTTDIDAASPAPDTAPPEPITQRRVLGLAIPIIGENLLQTGMSVVDTVIVAALGATALAGVGIASEVVFFLISIISAFSVAGTVVVSRAVGARDQEGANRLARQTVTWGLVVMVPLSVVTWVLTPALIDIFGTTPTVTASAVTYLRITSLGLGALLLTFVFGAVLRAAGDSRTPLYASTVANVVNAIASYLLVFGELGLPRLEVAGAAWGTIIGRSIGALILGWLLVSGRRAVSLAGRNGWRPSIEAARSLSHIGIPAAVERMVANIGITTLVLIVATIGTDALAAQQIIFTAFAVAPVPIFGLATATTVLVGQSLGARNAAGMRDAAAISLRWAMLWAILTAVVLVVFSRQIFGLFTSDSGVIDQGEAALALLGLTLPVWACHAVFGGSLRAMGDARTPMITNLVPNWLGVALAWAAVTWLDGGLTTVWAAQAVTSPIMLLIWPVFRRTLAHSEAEIAAEDRRPNRP
jgi:multidrug resistance protein, MATE family